MCSNYGLTEDFMLIERTLGILNAKLFVEEIELRPKDARLYCVGSVHASKGKFVTSLNKVFVSKYLLAIFLLLFIHSFQVASDFSVNPTKPH